MQGANMRQWRLIYDNPTFGAQNMAVDEAILTSVAAGNALPTLRVYDWSPLCLSLGYGQRSSDADVERLAVQGWGLVRRPTGGRAILHGDELTYSVALPADDELAQGDVVESYRRISEALMAALQLLGLSPESEKQAKGNRSVGPVCFEVPSHYEITSGGRKLIGSAQVRRKTGILQHGTLPLTGDIARICDALAYPDDDLREAARQQVRERATTLEQVCGSPVAWQTAADALVEGFAQTFAIEFMPGGLTEQEETHAAALQHDVYSNDHWTYKR
jgi:lipoyl(octanoyl) transferase